MARIDVLLPVKNGVAYLAESLDSVCAQSFTDWRLLVLDHGSDDGSREMAEQYAARDTRIVVCSFPLAKGLSGLLNAGLDICDAEYVMRHDADDICYPDRMAITLAAFDTQPDCVAIGGQADIIDGAGAPIGPMQLPVGARRVAAGCFFHNPIAHPTAMLRLSALRTMGARYGNDFLKAVPEDQRFEVHGLAEDYYLFGQLAVLGKCDNVPQSLIRYRWHGNNVGAKRAGEQMAMSLKISRFLARSFSILHGVPRFDPAPFCNHGGKLFDVDGRSNFDAEFAIMASALRMGFGDSPALEHELRYRHVISIRQEFRLLWRYNRYRSQHVPEAGEWNAIRAWLIRHFPGKKSISIGAEAAI